MSNPRPRAIYPFDEWKVVEETYQTEHHLRNETIFATGNGTIGLRGNLEEGWHGPDGQSVDGTYLNGFYESEPIIYGEGAYGYAKNSQTLLNVTDGKRIRLWVEGEPFHLFHGRIQNHKRTLDLKRGLLIREATWESPRGHQIRLLSQRLVSFTRRHVVAIHYTVEALNFDGHLRLESSLEGEVSNQITGGDPRTGSAFAGPVLNTEEVLLTPTGGALQQRTTHTGFTLASAMDHQMETTAKVEVDSIREKDRALIRWDLQAKKGQSVHLTKTLSYVTSKDTPEERLLKAATAEVKSALDAGFDKLAAEQRRFLDQYWEHSDIRIEGDPALQQGVRFNAFHLLQSTGRDGKTNISAKGLTGEGYEGHYFWDTETYILPTFLYSHPTIARKLLEYRYHILDYARERARELSHRGALYPWRTIGGEETSAYYPAGTAQYHINADIIHALKRYMNATRDQSFFLECGAEMLFETARFWADLGDWIPGKGFCLNSVTGPDEYTAIVNNNAYTNLMAQDHLVYAYTSAQHMRQEHPDAWTALADKIGLTDGEVAEWKQASDGMYIPYDPERGIIPQDDSFLEKAVWNFEDTPPDRYPLLLHYHPLVIYRHQVLKQADLVLALFLQSHQFSLAEKKRNYDYYEPLTTHDSSLSPCTHSILAAELGYREEAYEYFMRTARMDLDDYNQNVKDGVHTASMAGAWLSIVNGFAGMREEEGRLRFQPMIPDAWNRYRFRIRFQGRSLEVDISREKTTYTLLEGEPLTVFHQGRPVEVKTGLPVERAMKPELEGVIFDLDGVITDTAEYHYRAWKRLAEELGLPLDREWNEKLKGLSRMDSLERILAQGSRSYSDEEKQILAAKKNEYYRAMIADLSPRDLLPGIGELLQELKQAGIRIGLASASKNAPAVVKRLEIADAFDTIVDPARLAKGKPDPEIFLKAAEQLGLPPAHCLGIEDAKAGIQAIRQAQMFAVGVGDESVIMEADWGVPDTLELTLAALRQQFDQFHRN
ncbi:beta-phosphoglucomutase [Desmospora profundinema]|uniref:Alpha,alpha-trehalose phosphorylase n=1 Tax=Desmospora profundinema TaxID=1571184 RepID=A0ABU1IJY1_9BACL|nr:beta-phosphoglucomutase [Desmospora profundinema]MDR6225095.1 alpha,alpha-trehalose phosphorylase [Desmospora profundinema]